jgi:hypothetical protein
MKTTAAANACSTQPLPRQPTAGDGGLGRKPRPLARPRNQRPLARPRNQRPLARPRNQRAHAITSEHVGVGVLVCVGVVLSSIIDFKSFTAAAPIRNELCQRERRQPSRPTLPHAARGSLLLTARTHKAPSVTGPASSKAFHSAAQLLMVAVGGGSGWGALQDAQWLKAP